MSSRIARWTLSRAQRPPGNPYKVSRKIDPFLTSLPTEMLCAILDAMDDRSLHLMAAVSKLFHHLAIQSMLLRYNLSLSSGHVAITSSDALRALRVALVFHTGSLEALKYTVLTPTSLTKDVRRLEALLRRLLGGSRRVPKICIDFHKNIIERPVGWTIAGLAPYLLTTVCSQSQTALFIVENGIFTCKPKKLVHWNPYTRDQYYKITMHDGSRQWVPSIRSIESLAVTYPVCIALSPMQPWSMVVVNAGTIHTLLLAIKLTAPEWAAILSVIKLTHLYEVGIWAEEISATVSTAFLNRHPTLMTLKYMSSAAAAEPRHPVDRALALPRLGHLTARAHYVVRVLTPRVGDDPAPFPALWHVELFPDAQFPAALWLLRTHVPLTTLSLWFLTAAMLPAPSTTDTDAVSWPVFPFVEALALNKYDLDDDDAAARLPGFLAQIFTGLRTLELSHSFPKAAGTQAENRAVWKRKSALVRRIAWANTGVTRYLIDKEFFSPP
ncbi:hypothetical protein C8R46DRAFT_1046909 [Mycena filopes]|nr:hypothetical protein C8R46DRAFT_1046909 [Mycena filopes]